jgi:hypothetical protein
MMPVSFFDLQLAFEFVRSGGMGENEAYLDRESGKIYWRSEFGDSDEELPFPPRLSLHRFRLHAGERCGEHVVATYLDASRRWSGSSAVSPQTYKPPPLGFLRQPRDASQVRSADRKC